MTNQQKPEALRLADSYAKAHAMYCMEDLYGTSKSYTAELLKERHAARERLAAALVDAQQPACDTARYCQSVQRCTAKDESRAQQPAPKAPQQEVQEPSNFGAPATCDSPALCSVSRSCAGQFGTKRLCEPTIWTAQPAPQQPAPSAAAATEVENLRKALQFYADKDHFNIADEGAWDTVSGEPQNYWCDEEGTATVEDGTIARLALAGHQIKFEADEASQPSPTPQADSAQDDFISREEWVERAMRVYLIAGDTEDEARECAEYQWGELDMDDIPDPYFTAMEDIEGRGPAPQADSQPAPVRDESAAPKLRAMAINYPEGACWDKLDAQTCIEGALEIEALRAARAPADSVAAPAYSIDADQQGIRARVAEAITGALAFGAQGANPPPTGHWLAPFWETAREEASRNRPVSSDTLYLLRRLLSNQHTLTGSEFREELTKIVGEATQAADSVLEDADPLQGAANWLAEAHGQFCVAVLQGCLMIGYNRAKRLHDAAIAARKQGGA